MLAHVPSSVLRATALLFALPLAPPLVAQCATPWDPHGGLPGTNGIVNATATWDPDGPGPQGDVLVLAGNFTQAGPIAADDVATFEPTSGTWATFGSGLDGFATALCVLANGDLVVGGSFTSAGGVPAANVARWDGLAWSPLGAGTDGEVSALQVLGNGDLIAAGRFTTAGGAPASRVARWDGSVWTALGAGTDGDVRRLAVLGNGDLVAAGAFAQAGGSPAAHVARWDGTTWAPLGSGTDGPIQALAVAPNGDLVVGGLFSLAGGVVAPCIAAWSGTVWAALGDPASIPLDLARVGSELVLAGTTATNDGTVQRWDGTEWTPLAPPAARLTVAHVAAFAGEPLAAGSFQAIDGTLAAGLATFDGAAWHPPTRGLRPAVFAIAADAIDGAPIVATGGDDQSWTRVARGEGASRWHDLGLVEIPLGGFFGDAYALAPLPDGGLVVGGAFQHESGSASIVARDAVGTWQALGTGVDGIVQAVLRLPNGDLVAAGSFTTADGVPAASIARWDGAAWSALGSGLDGTAYALAWDDDAGLLIVGGAFTNAGGAPASRIAAWNGSSWSTLDSGFDGPVYALCRSAQGDLLVGGAFTTAGGAPAAHVARWNGTSWSPCGAGTGGTVFALAALPDGDFVAGGQFASAGGAPAANVARCDGSDWTPFGSGADDVVLAATWSPNGELWLGGFFTVVDGAPSRGVARMTTTCPPTVLPLGAGCAGAGSPKTLAADGLPWVDAPFRATGDGMPAVAFVVALTSLTALAPPLALDLVFAAAAPGCELLVAPDIVETLVADGGVARSTLTLVNTPPLVGVTFHHQMVVFEIDAMFTFVEITATNGLTLTAGDF